MLDINNMKRSDFYYDLPQELIAQTPVEPRNASRMMKINRQTGKRLCENCGSFQEMPDWILRKRG